MLRLFTSFTGTPLWGSSSSSSENVHPDPSRSMNILKFRFKNKRLTEPERTARNVKGSKLWDQEWFGSSRGAREDGSIRRKNVLQGSVQTIEPNPAVAMQRDWTENENEMNMQNHHQRHGRFPIQKTQQTREPEHKKDAYASAISIQGVAKGSAFALAHAQQDHTIAVHADNKLHTWANRTCWKVRAKYRGTGEVKMSSWT